jgi:DNA-binding MarR family transcriptional regulator
MTAKSDDQLDEFVAELWISVSRIMKRARHLGFDVTEEHDLTGPQTFTLWQIKESGPMTMGELSEALAVTHGVATRMVDRLIEKGMVERSRDEEDRRVVRVSVTDLGAGAAMDAIAGALEFIRIVFKGVSQSDREEYLSLLKRIEAAQEGGHAEA